MNTEPRWYAISSGNGNDGVSHTFPDYMVKTSDPYRLVELALVDQFEAGEGMAWAHEAVEVDGEAEYTISAIIYEGPEGETDFGAAWLIVEVFPAAPEDVEAWQADPWKRGRCYEDLESAFSAKALALVPSDG